jgi:RNA polymerase sigma factor (sigma-70 family)
MSTPSDNSVSQFIDGLKLGEERAAQKIWQRFYQRLLAQADQKLKASPRKAMDEEDVVQRAFADFFVQVRQGRFPKLNDRNDLWQVLAMLVDRRAKDQIKRQNTQKAGGGRVRTESVFLVGETSGGDNGIAQVRDALPTPELAMEMIELMQSRLTALRDDEQRQIALYKMQGYSNREIAEVLQSSERTVERNLQSIRKQWEDADEPGRPGRE